MITAEEIRLTSAGVVRLVFPKSLKRFSCLPGLTRFAINRARNGSLDSPVFRLSLWITALWLSGSGRERAQMLVDYLQDLIDGLWSTDALCARRASLLEQQLEGCSNPLQLAHAQGDASVRAELLALLRQERAATAVLIRALEREEPAELRRAA